jgi:hypothetical protein
MSVYDVLSLTCRNEILVISLVVPAYKLAEEFVSRSIHPIIICSTSPPSYLDHDGMIGRSSPL